MTTKSCSTAADWLPGPLSSLSGLSPKTLTESLKDFNSLVQFSSVQLLSRVRLFATPWTEAHQAPLSMGILQARVLEWVAILYSRRSSQPRDQTQVSYVSCIGRQVLHH